LKVDLTMAIWGVSFGIAATLTGMFVLASIQGGFLAEGFFLVVVGWVLLMVGVARLTTRLKAMRASRGVDEEEKE